MKQYTSIDDWTPDADCAFALGRFDGVHIGHQALLGRTVELAKERGLKPVCFSFLGESFPGARERGILTTADEKSELLEKIGFEILLQVAFEPPLINTTAADFINGLLVDRWKAKLIVTGYDYHFGKDRAGDAEFLNSVLKGRGVEVEIFQPVKLDSVPVKSTKIRQLIEDGKIQDAAKHLGRPYSIRSRQVSGRKLGREIGYPTMNFQWPELKVRPLLGVYAVRLMSGMFGKPANAVANYGLKPTTDNQNTGAALEVLVLDPEPDVATFLKSGLDTSEPQGEYEIGFIGFIRPEEKFQSIDDLKQQISIDCEKARAIHRENYPPN